jgi:hypothetical protein
MQHFSARLDAMAELAHERLDQFEQERAEAEQSAAA